MKKPGPVQQSRIPVIRQKMARRVEVVILFILLFVSTLHLLRLLTGTEIIIAGHLIPIWTSLVGFFGPLLLAGLFWWSRH
ncbi:hypothetical protein [Geothermobacter hydrogeniphilus]|uniref:Uncharacterized protein n=1 Tax=Geothermobacter hydrogeniphilus TaxID=1969733 RepID=A0A1X0Y8U0_9BACT|nr:hypothetical protein [Geothermobacter hydrogeniphilus]ORJ61611.1 hypothetical protein B5V00_06125 [Geothermobacter hydrogeniphilus]